MVDEDYFEDFNRRRPRRQTYRGSYTNPGSSQFFDPSADILAGIESVEKSIGKRKTAVRDFENAATVRRQETLDSLRETEGMSDTTAVDSLRQQLMNEVDELYKLDISSFEGDRSAYLKKAGEVNKIVETIPALMGLIDAEGETLKENQSSSQDFYKKLLRSNDPNYYDFVDAASKGGPGVSFRTQNGNIMAQLNGKDIFNGNAYVKAKKDGFDLVKYAGDYTPQINEADAIASKGLEALVSKEITEKVNKGIELVGKEKTNYTLAREKYEERLRSGNIPIPVNESTYQMFTNYGVADSDKKDPWGKDLQTQEGATKEAVIEYMIDQRFPEDVVLNKTTTKPAMTVAQQRADQRAEKAANKAATSSESKSYVPDVRNIMQGISNLKNDPKKGQTYFLGKKIKGREIIKVKLDNNNATFTTRSITEGGKVVEKAETYNLNNTNSINNLEDDLIETIIGSSRDAQNARTYAHSFTSQLISGDEDFSLPSEDTGLSIEQWRDSEENLVGGEDKDDEDYKKGILYKTYPEFSFEQAGFGTDKIIVTSPDGKVSSQELSTGSERDFKKLTEFIEKNSASTSSTSKKPKTKRYLYSNANFSKEDKEKYRKAKVGEKLEVVLNGKKVKIRKTK